MKLNKKIVCADGFTMSVQAHDGAYCHPRTDGAASYTEVEVGFPSAIEPLLIHWAEDRAEPTDTVYGYVPRQTVINVIAKHGGMTSGELPSGFPLLMVRGS
jgi:hypothetical protein